MEVSSSVVTVSSSAVGGSLIALTLTVTVAVVHNSPGAPSQTS